MRRSSNLQIKHLIHTWQLFSEYGTSNVSNSIRSPGKNCTAEERGNKINVCGSQKKKNRRERPYGKKRVNPMLWPEFLQLLIRRLRGLHVISARPNTLAHTHTVDSQHLWSRHLCCWWLTSSFQRSLICGCHFGETLVWIRLQEMKAVTKMSQLMYYT